MRIIAVCCVFASIISFAMADPVIDLEFTTIIYQIGDTRSSMAVGTGTTISYVELMPDFNPYPLKRESVFTCGDGTRMCAVIKTTMTELPEDKKGTPVEFKSTLEKVQIFTPGDLSRVPPPIPSVEVIIPDGNLLFATVDKGYAEVSVDKGEILISRISMAVSPKNRLIATWGGIKSRR